MLFSHSELMTSRRLPAVWKDNGQLTGRCSESYTAGQEYRQGVDDEYYVSLAQERGFYSFREKQSTYVAASFNGN